MRGALGDNSGGQSLEVDRRAAVAAGASPCAAVVVPDVAGRLVGRRAGRAVDEAAHNVFPFLLKHHY